MNNEPILIHTNDFYQDAANQYKSSQICALNREHYRVKPYHERFQSLFDLSRISAYFFSLCSIATATGCVYAFVSPVFGPLPPIASMVLSLVVSLLFLAILERCKHLAIPDALKEKYQFNKYSFLNVLAIACLFGVSAFLSFNGAQKVFQFMSAPPALISIDSIETAFRPQLDQLEQEEATARGMTWKGKIVGDGRALLINIAERKKTIQTQINYEKQIAMTENDRRTLTSTEDVMLWAFYFALFALFCDLSLIVSFWFQEHYRYYSHIQFSEPAINRLVSDAAINTTTFTKQPETKQPEPETKEPEIVETVETVSGIQKITNPKSEPVKQSMFQSVSAVSDTKMIQIHGLKPMTHSQAKTALKSYEWKLKNGTGNIETNRKRINQLKKALKV